MENAGLTPGVSNESSAASPKNERVIGLNLLVPGDSGKDHLRSTAETGEVVVANRADGDEQFGFHRLPVEPEFNPWAELADPDEPFAVAAVVLPDRHPSGQLPDQLPHFAVGRRGVSAAGHEDRDRLRTEPGSKQPIDDDRQHIRQIHATSDIRHHDHCGPAAAGAFDQPHSVDGEINSPRQQPPEITRPARRGGLKRTHPQTAEIDGNTVESIWQLDDHRITIALGIRYLVLGIRYLVLGVRFITRRPERVNPAMELIAKY